MYAPNAPWQRQGVPLTVACCMGVFFTVCKMGLPVAPMITQHAGAPIWMDSH
jgi:hypothetical protein